MDTGSDPTWRAGPWARSDAELGRLLDHLQQRLGELDRLHREIADDAQALARAATATPAGGGRAGARATFSIREAAAELGVSVSMLHKLLKERRLSHLKVGARTLITAEHLEEFRHASEVPAPQTPPAAIRPVGRSVRAS
jgi:excisionase family DNA binding protein